MTPIEAEARRAHGVAFLFWEALACDDSAAAGRLLSSAWSEVDRNRPGFAAAYREARELRPELMAHQGIVDRVEVLAADRVRFYFTLIGTGRYDAAEPSVFWRLELVLEDGEWLVDGTSKRPPVATLTLSSPPPEATPAAAPRSHPVS